MSSSSDPFRSSRLIYRAINLKEDVPLFVAMSADPDAEMAVNPNVPKVCAATLPSIYFH